MPSSPVSHCIQAATKRPSAEASTDGSIGGHSGWSAATSCTVSDNCPVAAETNRACSPANPASPSGARPAHATRNRSSGRETTVGRASASPLDSRRTGPSGCPEEARRRPRTCPPGRSARGCATQAAKTCPLGATSITGLEATPSTESSIQISLLVGSSAASNRRATTRVPPGPLDCQTAQAPAPPGSAATAGRSWLPTRVSLRWTSGVKGRASGSKTRP